MANSMVDSTRDDDIIDTMNKLRIPKVILRYIMMNFLDLITINNLLLTVKEMNVLDEHSKDLIIKANKGFIWNCKSGHLTIAKWLLPALNKVSGLDVYDCYKCAFRRSCLNGRLAVAQWLYSMDQYKIDIHADNEYVFRRSCERGHLAVAQWLYSIGGVDIHINEEYAFNMSCLNKHLPVAQWLYSFGGIYPKPFVFRWSDPSVLCWLNKVTA